MMHASRNTCEGQRTRASSGPGAGMTRKASAAPSGKMQHWAAAAAADWELNMTK